LNKAYTNAIEAYDLENKANAVVPTVMAKISKNRNFTYQEQNYDRRN
jgi:hypothetical protein